MNDYSELDFRHHDFLTKLDSISAALRLMADLEAREAAIECVLMLRTPMWRQGLWQRFEADVDLAIAAAAEAGLTRQYCDIIAYKAGLSEALGRWWDVVHTAREAMEMARAPAVVAEAAIHLGVALHQLGRPCEAARVLAESLAVGHGRDHVVRVLHKYHRILRAVGRAVAARRILDGIIDFADEWLRAEMLLDRASLLRRSGPHRALACLEEARAIYEKRAFVRGLAYVDLEEGFTFLALGQFEPASTSLARAEAAFAAEFYGPGRAHSAYAKALLARQVGSSAEDVSALFRESMNRAGEIGYVNPAARAALIGLHAHLRARKPSRAWAALAILSKCTAIRLHDFLKNGWPPDLSSAVPSRTTV